VEGEGSFADFGCDDRLAAGLPFPGGGGDGEIIEVYPGATLRRMCLASYKSRPEEAIRLGIAACVAAGIELEVAPGIMALCCRYSSGGKTRPPTRRDGPMDQDRAVKLVDDNAAAGLL